VEHFRIYPARPFGDDKPAGRADDVRGRLTSAFRAVDCLASVPASRLPHQPVSEREVRAMLKMRRDRVQFFDGELFAEPAWDILLELYAAELGQQRISVGNLCVGAAVPSTTALRWINILESKGLVERKADRMDGRRFYVSLSSSGHDAMGSYFSAVPVGTSVI